MTYSRIFSLFFIVSALVAFPIISMDKVPTIDFKDKSREELNRFAIEHEVLALTPRSLKSLQDKIQELGITINSGDFIYTALAANGRTSARPGDVVKFIATKQYYAQHKQMPPDSYRPIFVIQAPTKEGVENVLSDLFGPNGLPCAYPDLPMVGIPVHNHAHAQANEEDCGLSRLFLK